jgi:hypothetical protein
MNRFVFFFFFCIDGSGSITSSNTYSRQSVNVVKVGQVSTVKDPLESTARTEERFSKRLVWIFEVAVRARKDQETDFRGFDGCLFSVSRK